MNALDFTFDEATEICGLFAISCMPVEQRSLVLVGQETHVSVFWYLIGILKFCFKQNQGLRII